MCSCVLVGQARRRLLQPVEVVVAQVCVDREQELQVGVADGPAQLARPCCRC